MTLSLVVTPPIDKSVNQLIDLFFNDYSFAPLFISVGTSVLNHSADPNQQQNYLNVRPAGCATPVDTLEAVSRAADAICEGDIVESFVWQNMNFGMLPTLAVTSCIR